MPRHRSRLGGETCLIVGLVDQPIVVRVEAMSSSARAIGCRGTLQRRQGTKIAFRTGLFDRNQLETLDKKLGKSEHGGYLLSLARLPRR